MLAVSPVGVQPEAGLPGALELDTFAPRPDSLLLLLASGEHGSGLDAPLPASALEAKGGAWVSRVYVRDAGTLFQRPKGWTSNDRPALDDPCANVPFNAGFPENAPALGTVRCASHREPRLS